MAFSLAAGTLIFGAGLAGTLIAMTGYVSTLRILALLALLVAFPASLFLRYPPGYDRAPPHDKTADSGLDTRQMLKTPLFHRAWLWTCAVQTGGLMIIGHVTPYALEQGATPLQPERPWVSMPQPTERAVWFSACYLTQGVPALPCWQMRHA